MPMPLTTKPKPAAKSGAVQNMGGLLAALRFYGKRVQEKYF